MIARAALAAALVILSGQATAAAPPTPRNVLLISIDSLRADRLGAYGNPRATSPTIDRLAREGIRFEHALSPTSWTLPAHVTMLSGVSQRTHQVVNVGDRIGESLELLPQAFARAGYETAGFFSGPFLHPEYGFGRGFDTYESCASDGGRSVGPAAWDAAHADRTNARLESAFTSWVDRRSSRPFFAFVHVWDVHYDYIPPPPYDALFANEYSSLLDGTRIHHEGFPLNASAHDVARLLALYDGELRYTDDVLARILARLEAARVLDDTLVVITADHGEEFLEHGGKGHQNTLYQEVVSIPLIVWARAGLPQGRSVPTPVSLLDVAPTILALAGLGAPTPAEGRSLVPLLHGEDWASRPVLGELYASLTPTLRLVSVRSGNLKVLYDARRGSTVSFDLAADRWEQRPLPSTDGALDALARDVARRAEAALERRRAAARDAAPGPPPAVADRLRALGYVP